MRGKSHLCLHYFYCCDCVIFFMLCLYIGHTFCSSLIKSDQHQMSDAETAVHHAACYLYYTSQLYLIHLIFVVCWSWVFSNGFGHSLSVSTFIYFNIKLAVAIGLLNICVKYVEFVQKLTKTYKEVRAIQVIYCKLIDIGQCSVRICLQISVISIKFVKLFKCF